MPPVLFALFVPGSLGFMVLGAVFVAWRLLFVTLAFSIGVIVVATMQLRMGRWSPWTLILALAAAISHLGFLLYA